MRIVTRAEDVVKKKQREVVRDLAESIEQMDRLELDGHDSERLRSMVAKNDVARLCSTALVDDNDIIEIEVERKP